MNNILEEKLSNKYKNIKISKKVAIYIITIIALFLIAFPFIWLVLTSFKYPGDFQAFPPVFFPKELTLEHYYNVINKDGILPFFFNSITIAISTTIITIFIGSLTAFTLSKHYLSLQIRRGIMYWILVTRIFPPITTAIPYYVLISKINLTDTHIALILSYVSYCLPFVIWLQLGFFQDFPQEVENAAIVDGSSFWQRFFTITLPITLPGIAVSGIFCFILGWNEFLYASILTSVQAKTLPVVLASFISDKYLDWGSMSAMSTLMVVPVLLIALFAQKYLVRGLTFGAVKG